MTEQVGENLLIDGEQHEMFNEPLRFWFALSGVPSPFLGNSSACWRGYIGEWLIESRRLYLIGIQNLDDEPIPLSKIFPDNPKRVFAHWVTGEVRCPEGKLLNYVHGGYASNYERDLFLEFRQGVSRPVAHL